MITLYMRNSPGSREPKCDYVRVVFSRPARIKGYRLEGAHLVPVPISAGYLAAFRGWYHPATAWEIQEYRRLGGDGFGARQS